MSEGHFGPLDDQVGRQITEYLKANSAESSTTKISKRILASLGANRPTKIMDIPYIRKEHEDVSADDFKRKAKGIRSNCIACHAKANKGNYDDD